MVIEKFFIYYKKPSQYIYWGERNLDVFAIPTAAKDKQFKKIRSHTGISLTGTAADNFAEAARELPSVDTGIFLNSGNFIFNIFDFEKIPWQEHLKRELVEWRVKKVFPENIDDYEHHFHHLSKNRILSILFKKSIKEKIEQLFKTHNIPLIHMGNSTVEILNHMSKLKKDVPDFFVEIDSNLCLSVFMEDGIPYYIRKFRIGKPEDLAAEIIKTITFVKNSYTKIPGKYSLVTSSSGDGLDFDLVRNELSRQELQLSNTYERDQFFFAGKKR